MKPFCCPLAFTLTLAACHSDVSHDCAAAVAALDVTVSVDNPSSLPTDSPVSFGVDLRPDGGDLDYAGDVAIGDTLHVDDVTPGKWGVYASFSWYDATKVVANTDDTGGYMDTECYGSDQADVSRGETVAVSITARCSDESTGD